MRRPGPNRGVRTLRETRPGFSATANRADSPVLPLAISIARAACKDSLRWWEDEALTEAGSSALGRLFARHARAAAMRLALLSARERHQGELQRKGTSGRSLFDLAITELDEGNRLPSTVGLAAITSVDDFRARLTAIVPDLSPLHLPRPNVPGLFDITSVLSLGSLDRATAAVALAAAYLHGLPESPVFPFFRPEPTGALR